jgi:hypothetical protein
MNRQLQKASEINKIWIPEKSGFGLICLRDRAKACRGKVGTGFPIKTCIKIKG